MWRGLVLTIPLALLIGCGSDDGETTAGDETTAGGETTAGDEPLAEQLGDDPTFEECMDGIRQILESIEVPEGFEPQDGIDEDERSSAEAAIRAAFENEGLDADGEDDPCAQHVGDEADAATAEIMQNLDPEVLAVITGATG